MVICKALLKEGYSGFRLEILEYISRGKKFDKNLLLEREQHYLDTLKPEYNILKIAGSSLGYKASEKTKALISLAAKGRVFSLETREKMATSSTFKKAVLISKAGMKETLLFTSIVEAAKYIGLSRSQVSRYIKLSKPYKEFTISTLTKTVEIENLSEETPSNRKPFKQPILLTNLKTGKAQEFSSIADTAKYLNLTPIQLRNALNKDVQNIEINGYKFTKLAAISPQFEPNNMPIEVTNVNTQEVTVYSSLTSAAKAIGVHQPSLSVYLKRNSSRPFKRNYFIRRLDKICTNT
jgi:hypothetical protein